MADNRMYLRCKNCGEVFYMGKRLGGGYYVTDENFGDGKKMIDHLNAFYSKHEYEDTEWRRAEEERTGRWQGLDCFEIVYEMDDDFEEKVTGYFDD